MPRRVLALATIAVSNALRARPSLAARQHAADAAAKALGGNPIDLSVPSMSAATMPPSMVAGGAAQETYDGVRIGPPPDLASLLLHNRIVYLGMPMVSAVTELIVAELLYLNYESPSKPVTLYINSPGTVNAQGQAVGFETEAFAIADCWKQCINHYLHAIDAMPARWRGDGVSAHPTHWLICAQV